MADVHSKSQRSYNMSMIKGKNTKPEIIIRKLLHSKGYRFRVHDKKLPGKPDIVLKKYKTVINVHGCFWHGHKGCRYFVIPKTRTKWWIQKITLNKENDKRNKRRLMKLGWLVIDIWECQTKNNMDKVINIITDKLH